MKTAKQMRAEHVGECEVKLHATPIEAAKEQRRLDALRFSGAWIDASKELPDSDQTVLIHCPKMDEPVWLGYHTGEEWRDLSGGLFDDTSVKHWTQLPEPPKP